MEGYASERSDEEISVGCPSPAPRSCSSEEEKDDYFRPLKRLKMMQIDQVSYSIGKGKTKKMRPRRTSSPALKSFSILDILSHRNNKDKEEETLVSSTRIVRPWDEVPRLAPPLLYRLPPHPELYETCSSGRSSASDCTSPDIINCTLPRQQQPRKSPNSSPLDALFQMTSKTFEELNGEQSQGNSSTNL